MQKFNVSGMSCAVCVAHVEKAVKELDGVKEVNVSLLTNSMTVEYDSSVTTQQICDAVKKAGYEATLPQDNDDEPVEKKQIRKLKRRLVLSLCFLVPLMYISMGHMIGLPLPPFLSGTQNALWYAVAQLVLTLPVCIINKDFFINGVKGFIKRSLSMDALVSLGAGAAIIYGIFAMIHIGIGLSSNDLELVNHYMHDLYFESAAMILTLITLGKLLEAFSKGKTTSAIKSLMELSPPEATLLIDGKETVVPVENVKKGDIFIIKPGEKVPVDAVILEGTSSVDNSAFTGESMPEDVFVGDKVNCAAINQQGVLICKAEKVGEDTSLSQVIRLVQEAANTKAPLAKSVDKVSAVFVPTVIILSVITFVIWMIIKGDFSFSLARAISVLVISCPCALGLATPVAIMVGNGLGAKNGVLFKTAAALEHTGKIETMVLDKTGTITKGTPYVVSVLPSGDMSEQQLVKTAVSIEAQSEHPLAKAIVKYAEDNNILFESSTNVTALSGKGLQGEVENALVVGGSLKFMKTVCTVSKEAEENCIRLSRQGATPLVFSQNGEFIGIIGVADVIKETSKEAISQLQNLGIDIYMLTGDNKNTAVNIGSQVGLSENFIFSDVLPSDKDKVVKQMQKKAPTAMVGDGINDAPALTSADVGIAIGSGTDIAIDAADVVLVSSDLKDVASAVRLSRGVIRNIHQNLFWAFFYNAVCIPTAAGCLYPLGIVLNPMIAAAAMSLSSVSVVLNALRLNTLKIKNPRFDRPRKHKKKQIKKENNIMTKTMTIEGMMCPHCEARVKNVLESLDGVVADVRHQENKAYVECTNEIDNETLKRIVEEQGYKVINIE